MKRPVLLERAEPLRPVIPPRNVIIEYEPLKAYTVRRVIEEGVFRVDPRDYERYQHQIDGDVRLVDRIDDLPPPSGDLQRVLHEYRDDKYVDIPEDYAHLFSNRNGSTVHQHRQTQGSSVVSPTSVSNPRP